MSAVKLMGGALRTDAERFTRELEGPHDVEWWLDRWQDHYPSFEGIAPLEPDLLGEALVWTTLERLAKRGTAERFLARLLDGASEAQAEGNKKGT